MFHSGLPPSSRNQPNAPGALDKSATDERRRHARLECAAEVVIAWNHDLDERVRLRLMNISEGGMQIASTFPLLKHATGIAINILPEGVGLNRVFCVAWVKRNEAADEYRAGLRFLN